MKDFIFDIPEKVYFGKNQIAFLPDELKKFGNKVLLVYGGGSIKKNGIYDEIVSLILRAGLEFFELSGVEPNPRHTTANKGARICKDNGVDVVLAVGGGSTIDCAKGVAAATMTDDCDVWKLVSNGVWVTEALPVVAVLTNAATGSEMNCWAVISNMDTNEKIGMGGSALLPRVAFENPEYGYSLPTYQTACGAFDIFSHIIDKFYFAGDDSFDIALEMQEAVLRTVVKWVPIAMKEPTNYQARANLTWASSMALNTVLDGGTVHSSSCHAMEHELSAYYDITHGHGLAILTPRWLEYALNESTAPSIYRLGVKVFNVSEGLPVMEGAKKTIDALSDFCFNTLGLKSSLSELGIDEKYFNAMARHVCRKKPLSGLCTLDVSDIEKIYKMCL